MLHSAHGRKIAGNVARISVADRTQSIPHTGHFILLPKMFHNRYFVNYFLHAHSMKILLKKEINQKID
jgi:hypothetical protein